MSPDFRPLSGPENTVARRLEWEAFGFPQTRALRAGQGQAGDGPSAAPAADAAPEAGEDQLYGGASPTSADWPGPGFHTRAAFDGQELLGQVMAREFHTWSQAARIPTCGVAGVTIGVEHRGRGLMAPLLRGLLGDARQRGDAIATLYATAPGVYQRFGFERITSAHTATVPAHEAAAVRGGAPVRLRRARLADVPALRHCYQQWASARTGALDRVPPSFQRTDEQLLGRYDAITMALGDDGACLGYVAWRRGRTGSEVLHVDEFIAVAEAAYRALWRMLGSFQSVVDRIEVRTCDHDPARSFLPGGQWSVSGGEPYMLRVLDVRQALTARTGGQDGTVTFTIDHDECGLIEGTYRVHASGTVLTCQMVRRTGEEPRLSVGGLSALYGGQMSAADLHATGHLHGGTQAEWASLEGILARQPWQVRDEF